MANILDGSRGSFDWLKAGGTYLGVTGIGHLFWEIAQLPLYTIWTTETLQEQAFAIIHCTFGDLLIALSALIVALIITCGRSWPRDQYWRVASAAIGLGIIYTAYSEWLNVTVRATWAYSEWMPIISLFGLNIGLSPILQWIIVPGISFLITKNAIGINQSTVASRN